MWNKNPYPSLLFIVWCTEAVELFKVAHQVWFTTAAEGEQEHLVSTIGNKNNYSEIRGERLICACISRGPLKANTFPVLIPTIICTSAPQTHLLLIKLIESYWLCAEATSERQKMTGWLENGVMEWKVEKRKLHTAQSGVEWVKGRKLQRQGKSNCPTPLC